MLTEFLASLKLPNLTDKQLAQVNTPFTLAETIKTIESISNGKFPDLDGFTSEY